MTLPLMFNVNYLTPIAGNKIHSPEYKFPVVGVPYKLAALVIRVAALF